MRRKSSQLNQYLTLNSGFGSPIVYKLTRRGFYSEINNLLNAVFYGLVTGRRLIADESDFQGLRWSDFFTAQLPGLQRSDFFAEHLPSSAAPTLRTIDPEWIIDGGRSRHFSTMRKFVMRLHDWHLPLWIPSMSLFGSVFRVKRELAAMLTKPLLVTSFPDGLTHPYAAFHVRRGDKIKGRWSKSKGKRGMVEGEDVPLSAYVELLDRKAPEIKSIFLMTDDYSAADELRSVKSGRALFTFAMPGEQGYEQPEFDAQSREYKVQSCLRLINETQIAAASSIFIGGFKSNVARFVTLIHAHPEVCFSIDGQRRWTPK